MNSWKKPLNPSFKNRRLNSASQPESKILHRKSNQNFLNPLLQAIIWKEAAPTHLFPFNRFWLIKQPHCLLTSYKNAFLRYRCRWRTAVDCTFRTYAAINQYGYKKCRSCMLC